MKINYFNRKSIFFKIIKVLYLTFINFRNNLVITIKKNLNFLETCILKLLLPSYNKIIKSIIKLYKPNKFFNKKKVIFIFSEIQKAGKIDFFSKFKSKSNLLSTENYFLKNSLECTDMAYITTNFFDNNINQIPILGDLYLLFLCYLKDIEYLIISNYDPILINGTPVFYTLNFISRVLQIKLISIWWDTVEDDFYEKNKHLILLSYKNIYSDTSSLRSFYRSSKSDLNLGPAIDPNLITIKEFEEKDIDIIFLGSNNSYRSYRNKYLDELNLLKNEGINVFIGGGHGYERLTFERYFHLLGRSKICINFSGSVDGKHQIKARVYEAISSKCLLLESHNNLTSHYFDKDLDYISFESPKDMSNKIRFYLKNQDLLIDIANRGHKRFQSKYNHFAYWKKILD